MKKGYQLIFYMVHLARKKLGMQKEQSKWWVLPCCNCAQVCL